jgi:hypothetical protein
MDEIVTFSAFHLTDSDRHWITDHIRSYPGSSMAYVFVSPLERKRRVTYLKTQFVPRSKHFSSRLQKPTS